MAAIKRTISLRALLLACALLPAVGQAGLNVSELPLFLNSGATPNVVMTIDDSGSMARGYVPDSLGESSNRRNSPLFTAATYNALYYNPALTYAIPSRSDGVSYATSFTRAWVNGFDTSRGSVDLSQSGYRPIYNCTPDTSSGNCSRATGASVSGSTTTTTYRYTGCTLEFENRSGRRADRITVTGCTPALPATDDGSPAEADASRITVSGTSNNNGNYTVASSERANQGVRITLSNATQVTRDSVVVNATLQWTQTVVEPSSPASAYYHLYYTDKPGAGRPANCSDSVEDRNCYVLVVVGSAEDITPGDAAVKRQNFANWYSFYRSRALATISAAMNAVTGLSPNQVRLAWQSLNSTGCTSFGTTCRGYDGTNRENRMRTLDALKTGSNSQTHRTDFYDWITRLDVSGGTPLRSAMERAGVYFSSSGLNSPYAQEPHVTQGRELSCRRNFHVMMTDGLWNGDGGSNFGGNVDSTARTLPDGKSYEPRYPYRNPAGNAPSGMTWSNSLADIAFKFWATDLRSGLANDLTPLLVDRSGTESQQYWNPRNNPATWQHMVNYTISFGLGSVMTDPVWGGSTYNGDYPALASGSKAWPPVESDPSTSSSPEEHVYDLWHAAINSRGQFFNGDDPQSINTAFQSVFNSIIAANPSSSSLAANSTNVQSGAVIYQAKFDSTDWHGQLVALGINADGVAGAPLWDASARIPTPQSRNITTWDGTRGSSFQQCNSDLSLTQRTDLGKTPGGTVDNACQARVDWLRGSRAQEQASGGSFRDRRVSVLGDMINSDPVYVHDQDYGYAASSFAGGSTYAAYVGNKASRLPMVYIGANDGMLHGFRADVGASGSGSELMAHVPAAVVPKLNRLMDPGYSHTFYVDGSPTVHDAYIGNAWKTVLVSGLGAGGRSVFALDITDPAQHGPSKVMWEFSDPDLGFTFSQPQIARLNSGHWVAVFGNGYNSASTNEKAWLFVVDLATGSLLKKLQAGGTASSNGLSTPALIDTNHDKIADLAYAGDLQGNVWKFDLSGTSTAAWSVANGGQRLFRAADASGRVQPITVKPALALPASQPQGGVMVLFGTGRYLTSTDPADTATQSFYAIWDNFSTGEVSRSQLRPQAIENETSFLGFDLRQTTAHTVDYTSQRGWYMDLSVPGQPVSGERVISNAMLRYDRVIFMTMIPSTDVCMPGGSSWLMELDAFSGSRTRQSVFDLNNDGFYDLADQLPSGATAGGIRSSVGITKTPAWLEQGRSSEHAFKLLSGSTGGISSVRNRKPAMAGTVRRVFWQQIQ